MLLKRPAIKSIELKSVRLVEGSAPTTDPESHWISHSFKAGTNCHIRGASGVGKSHLLRVLVGLLPPKQGLVYMNENLISEMSFHELVPYRLNLGFSFEM